MEVMKGVKGETMNLCRLEARKYKSDGKMIVQSANIVEESECFGSLAQIYTNVIFLTLELGKNCFTHVLCDMALLNWSQKLPFLSIYFCLE